MLYNGNAAYEKGAVVCRLSPSFIRFGNFQILAARGDTETLTQLLDYTMTHFFPDCKGREAVDYIQFFHEVAERTLDMIVHWQRVGFVHGVMNTDNMSILGLTIDYGPYGWLEGYDPGWTPNTTDAQGKRYRFGNQLQVALWNLLQLGNAIYAVVDDVPALEKVLKYYQDELPKRYLKMMNDKLGLNDDHSDIAEELISQLEEVLQLTETDMTIFYRNLAQHIADAFYKPEEVDGHVKEKWYSWCDLYLERLRNEARSDADRRAIMNTINPKYVLRNYMAQMAIDKADQGDYALINELYLLLKHPYAEQMDQEKWFAKRPEWARHKVGCSMLSCSS
ncbi:UNVERIFIED_CONTAM: hypothetical protein GTU68_006404 [Idotea baltica]|nr:hypothetical protein [Idotea baltica]